MAGQRLGRRHPRPPPRLGDLRDDDLRLHRRRRRSRTRPGARSSRSCSAIGIGPDARRVRALARAQGRLLGEGGAQVDRRDDRRRLPRRDGRWSASASWVSSPTTSRRPSSRWSGSSAWSGSRSPVVNAAKEKFGMALVALLFWPASVAVGASGSPSRTRSGRGSSTATRQARAGARALRRRRRRLGAGRAARDPSAAD